MREKNKDSEGRMIREIQCGYRKGVNSTYSCEVVNYFIGIVWMLVRTQLSSWEYMTNKGTDVHRLSRLHNELLFWFMRLLMPEYRNRIFKRIFYIHANYTERERVLKSIRYILTIVMSSSYRKCIISVSQLLTSTWLMDAIEDEGLSNLVAKRYRKILTHSSKSVGNWSFGSVATANPSDPECRCAPRNAGVFSCDMHSGVATPRTTFFEARSSSRENKSCIKSVR